VSVLRGAEPSKLAKGYRIHDNPRDPIPQVIFLVRRTVPPLVREKGFRCGPIRLPVWVRSV